MNYKDYTYEHTNCAMTPIQYEHLIDLLKNFKPKRKVATRISKTRKNI